MTQVYRVNEIFDSYQGEGYWTGVPATFIRLQGCPVGCEWCDTKYTWGKGGTDMTLDQILGKVNPGAFVVITGGEPLLWNLDDLLHALHKSSCFTQIETSGFCWFKGVELPRWITWSPKPKLAFKAPVEMYQHCNEVKWVIDDEVNVKVIYETWMKCNGTTNAPIPYRVPVQVTLMPEGAPPSTASLQRAKELFESIHNVWNRPKYMGTWRIMDRMQYRLGVK